MRRGARCRSKTTGLLTIGLLTLTACSASVTSSGPSGNDVTGAGVPLSTPTTLDAPSTEDTDPPPPTVAATSSTAASTSTSTTTTTTPVTTTLPETSIFDPACVVTVADFDSLGSIASQFDDETVNVVNLRAENGLPTADLETGQLLDVCAGNGLDDITGEQRSAPDEAVVAAAVLQNVEVQQLKLNKLFDGLGTTPLAVDGVSGPVTRQRLCAARLALGLPTSTADMAAGSAEETTMLNTAALTAPASSATASNRWILIDRTCQMMFAGQGTDQLTYVFPTSTGSEGHATRLQERSPAFRFDPALDNGGWHDSSDFPVPADNPLNGNMYKPLYFDNGQAIHGANNVPTSPQSKGCSRLRVDQHNQLVAWLGLDSATSPVWNPRQIDVTVNVQGEYAG